ncbi:MAG: AAA family ATPase [Lentisphaeria bacterium]|nr:AAA family ATPase [Lentisphaeria bacterium]
MDKEKKKNVVETEMPDSEAAADAAAEKESSGAPKSPQELVGHIRDVFEKMGLDVLATPIESMNPGFRPAAAAQEAENEAEKPGGPLQVVKEFSFKPKEIRDYLDRFVISQNEAKKVLATAICDHYNHVRRCLENPELARREFSKHNVIMLGPTGVGKTYLMRCIAKLIGVPFVKADATKFSETGYVGYDVEDIVRDLVKAADGDIELAKYGIVYLDEIDKIAGRGSEGGGKDVSGRGVQINLLKLMEDTDVKLIGQTDMLGQMQAMMALQTSGKAPPGLISTKYILFIVSGAFDRMREIVKRRLGNAQIGFHAVDENQAADSDAAVLKQVQTQDFVKFGFEPEFIGRLPVRVVLDELDVADLEQILQVAENGILQQYEENFAGYDIELQCKAEALHEVALRAVQEKTGARGLMTILERLFRDFKFELPGTGVKLLELNEALVKQPEVELQRLLQLNEELTAKLKLQEVYEFAKRFEQLHELKINFSEEAALWLQNESGKQNKTVRGFCEERFKDIHHGLLLLASHSGKKEFDFDLNAVSAPSEIIAAWIRDSLKQKEA